MSIEYTIDIQLTELGFPDILQPQQTQARDGKEAAKQSSEVSVESPLPHEAPCKQSNPAQDEQAVDSDDSEVSGVYEEEEVDDEDEEEEEEGPSDEPGLSRDHRCSVCHLQLPSQFKLQDHMNLHTGARPYGCAECGKRFCQIQSYRSHLRTHAKTKVDPLKCRVCLWGFTSQEELKDHLSKMHLEDKFYECDLCKRVFTCLEKCQAHVQLHKYMNTLVCKICGRTFSSETSLAHHSKKACHRSFKCTDCARVFTKKNALLKHSFSHLGLLPYTCIRCRCHFRLARLYRQHRCLPERIRCVACLREFLSQEEFQQHKKDTGCWGDQERSDATDEIRCLECGQRFDTSEELKKHAGAHQRVLKCAECGKGFRSALLLMSHMGGHAGQSPCLCQSCGLGFPHQQNFDSHLKTCGQTPQPASVPRKRTTLTSSSPETKRLKAKPNTPNVAKPRADHIPDVVNKAAAPVKDSARAKPATRAVPFGSGQSDGLWKLTLDKQPPPGVKLVVFVPVCPTQPPGLALPSAVSRTVPLLNMQTPSVSGNRHLGAKGVLGAPLDSSAGIQNDPEAPLDLSKKSNSSKSAITNIPSLPIKSEPEELEIS
ncbi:oocyte zinc finger protein XlCOF6 [Mugil cephalus]|uniref:oocyte zinc finger protein XlCOF6 n=1 Tax=Mugil cephalus TaxID=48193 RepID=UPI001FB59A79|nr:oocyte zinc finger protein XlCOF6 [Mugil cephalus]